MIKNIDVMKDSAAVDVEYSGQYQFMEKERDRWATAADKIVPFVAKKDNGKS